jgi:tRNA G18 (ribose-2'-O)-methylase SpoU
MVTDRYQHIHHHPTVQDFISWAGSEAITVIGIDNVPGSEQIETAEMPEKCVLVFGQEGPGLSEEMIKASKKILAITQYGSTRSINAGVASGIAMYEWLRQHSAN